MSFAANKKIALLSRHMLRIEKKAQKKRRKKKFRVCFPLDYVQRRDFVSVLGSRL